MVFSTTWVQFLAMILDSVRQTLELAKEKLKKLAEVCEQYATAKKVTKVQLQSLLGHICFAARGVRGA